MFLQKAKSQDPRRTQAKSNKKSSETLFVPESRLHVHLWYRLLSSAVFSKVQNLKLFVPPCGCGLCKTSRVLYPLLPSVQSPPPLIAMRPPRCAAPRACAVRRCDAVESALDRTYRPFNIRTPTVGPASNESSASGVVWSGYFHLHFTA